MIFALLRKAVHGLDHSVVVRVQVQYMSYPHNSNAKSFILFSIYFKFVRDLLQLVKLFDHLSLREICVHLYALELERLRE